MTKKVLLRFGGPNFPAGVGRVEFFQDLAQPLGPAGPYVEIRVDPGDEFPLERVKDAQRFIDLGLAVLVEAVDGTLEETEGPPVPGEQLDAGDPPAELYQGRK
ncbi:MAG TPA: hypothetical protein PKK95_09220 [Vicinamibacterales bacterium]|nr:hypothetical protein [Vicinamibacterales bacterium]